MDEVNTETLDLSKRGLKKLEKAQDDESTTIINLILDQNELQRLENIDTYERVENLSVCNNFLVRMHGVSRLKNIRVLSLNNNGILQIEGLKDMIYLKVLKLAGNNIKSIEHLNNNIHLEHLDLSNNQISFIADICYLKSLKNLNLERNRIADLRQCDRYLPPSLEHLALANNSIKDLNEVSFLSHLGKLESLTVQGNPCVAMSGKEKIGFDYRPFVLNWILSVKSIDGFAVSAIESLKAEWLYSQGKGRSFHAGQHAELCEYLASSCPRAALAPETEDQRKLRLILSKAQHHQQQLKDNTNSPVKSRIQSPRMQCRITARHMGRSPDRMTSSYHSARASPALVNMTQSCDAAALGELRGDCLASPRREPEPPSKPINQSLEAASKMVPVPESLMSPDYHDPLYDIHRVKQTHTPNNSACEEKRQIVQPNNIHKNVKGSPKLTKSATSSPKLRLKMERKGSLKIEAKEVKVNGEDSQRKKKDELAAVTIQKMWRGYRSRNLNKDSLRILHAIQAARARQHIQRLTCDMEATKAALESERKIQQLQMQAINALWKKVSTLQDNNQKHKPTEPEDNTEVLRQLTMTCSNLQSQVVELQGCMQQILRCVRGASHAGAAHTGAAHTGATQTGATQTGATQTDAGDLVTPQEESRTSLKRPQSLQISATSAPAAPLPKDQIDDIASPLLTAADISDIQSEDKRTDTQSVSDETQATENDVDTERSIVVD